MPFIPKCEGTPVFHADGCPGLWKHLHQNSKEKKSLVASRKIKAYLCVDQNIRANFCFPLSFVQLNPLLINTMQTNGHYCKGLNIYPSLSLKFHFIFKQNNLWCICILMILYSSSRCIKFHDFPEQTHFVSDGIYIVCFSVQFSVHSPNKNAGIDTLRSTFNTVT